MLPVALTFARIVDTRTVNDRVLYDIAVQVEGGELRMGSIESGGLVFADGLIVGMLTGSPDGGRTFRPMRQGGSVQASTRARITGSAVAAYGQWDYTWVEVIPDPDNVGEYLDKPEGRTSATAGVARNMNEVGNQVGGTLGSGINANNLPSGFAPVPVGVGAVVMLYGPYGDATPWWEFELSGHVDGTCGGAA